MKEERYLNIKQLSAKLGDRSRPSLYRDMKEGRIPRPLKMGAQSLWKESDIDAAMDALMTAPKTEPSRCSS